MARKKQSAPTNLIIPLLLVAGIGLLIYTGGYGFTTFRCADIGDLSEYKLNTDSFRAWSACGAGAADYGKGVTLEANIIKGNQYGELLDWTAFTVKQIPADGFVKTSGFKPPGASVSYYEMLYTVETGSPADDYLKATGAATQSLETYQASKTDPDGICDGYCADYLRMEQDVQGSRAGELVSYVIGPKTLLGRTITTETGWTCQYKIGLRDVNGNVNVSTGEGTARGHTCIVPPPKSSSSYYDTRTAAEFTTSFTGIPTPPVVDEPVVVIPGVDPVDDTPTNGGDPVVDDGSMGGDSPIPTQPWYTRFWNNIVSFFKGVFTI